MSTVVSGYTLETIVVDRGSGTVRSQFDREQTPPSMAVIATLADVMDVDQVELAPLNASVDPDALDAIVGVRHGAHGDIHVTFTYEGYSVGVSSDGVVTISDEQEPAAEHSGRDLGR